MTRDLSDWRNGILTVRDLRERLSGLPDDMPIILEKDAEGNGYSPLSSVVTDARYEPESTWSGECRASEEDWNPEDYHGDTYEEYAEGSFPVVILGPVN
jgi:hypothetical protein